MSGARKAMLGLLVVAMTSSACLRTIAGVHLPNNDSHDWATVERLIAGSDVVVTLDTAEMIEAKVTAVSDTGIELGLPTGLRSIDRQHVVRIVAMESSKAGAKRGLILGFLFGSAIATVACINGETPSSDCPKGWLIGPGLLAATGTAVGSIAHVKVTVYER